MHEVSVQDIETILPSLSEWASRTHIYKFKDGSLLDSGSMFILIIVESINNINFIGIQQHWLLFIPCS